MKEEDQVHGQIIGNVLGVLFSLLWRLQAKQWIAEKKEEEKLHILEATPIIPTISSKI